jgi:UDP-N-acetylglucosamine transferase subunit ALG13
MIFVTVGTQLPFPRLVSAAYSACKKINYSFVMQTGKCTTNYENTYAFLNEEQLSQYLQAATLIVGHAGMGTILTGLSAGKPVVIMPRIANLGEHRNEHQLATCHALEGTAGLYIAWDESQLLSTINKALDRNENFKALSAYAPKDFETKLRQQIQSLAGF